MDTQHIAAAAHIGARPGFVMIAARLASVRRRRRGKNTKAGAIG
jgi:hypothetical protein